MYIHVLQIREHVSDVVVDQAASAPGRDVKDKVLDNVLVSKQIRFDIIARFNNTELRN